VPEMDEENKYFNFTKRSDELLKIKDIASGRK
jgi:hypothetical protein